MKTMVAFVQSALLKHGGVDRFGPHLLAAGAALNTFVSACGEGGPTPTPDQMSTIRDSYDTHLRCCRACDITLSPKHHLCAHLVDRTGGRRKHGESLSHESKNESSITSPIPYFFQNLAVLSQGPQK